MGIALFHGDFAWLLAGIVVFVGIMVLLIKVARGHIGSVLASLAVWILVYSLHSGSNTGIMTATVAALMFDIFGLPLLKLFSRR